MNNKTYIRGKIAAVQKEYERCFFEHINSGKDKNDTLTWNCTRIQDAIFLCFKHKYDAVFKACYTPCPRDRYVEFGYSVSNPIELAIFKPAMKVLCNFYCITHQIPHLFGDSESISLIDIDKIERYCSDFNAFFAIARNDFEKAVDAFIDGETMVMPIHTTQKASSYSMLTSKVAREYLCVSDYILSGVASNGQLCVNFTVASNIGKQREDSFAIVGLNYEGIELTSKTKINPYDKTVYNAVCSLWQAGNRKMTTQDVFRTLNGNITTKVKDSQIERVNNSMRKFMGTTLVLDLTDEMKKTRFRLNDSRVKKGIIESRLLHADRITLTLSNGKEVSGYKIYAEPILYTYSKAKKQIITVPVGLLDTSDSTSNTDDVIVIREYLLQQIENMKDGGFRDSHRILYKTLYAVTGIDEPKDRDAVYNSHKQIKALLESWKKRGHIEGYTDVIHGRSIVGIYIETKQ